MDSASEPPGSASAPGRPLLCPSAQPEWDDSVAFGVVGGTVARPRVAYLAEPLPVTDELLVLSSPVRPTEVLRFAAPCACSGCAHFDGTDCSLATRLVQLLPAVVDAPPPCRVRPSCRWWRQEGGAACFRCPQVVTDSYHAPEHIRRAADPATRLDPPGSEPTHRLAARAHERRVP